MTVQAWGTLRVFGRMGSLALLFVMSACGQIIINDKCDCGFFATQSSKILIWPKSKREVTFYFHNSVPTKAKPAMLAAAATYNDSLESEVKIVIKDDDQDSPIHGKSFKPNQVQRDGINGIYWISKDWPFATDGESHEDGMTLIDFAFDGIKEADVFIRGESFADLTASGFQVASNGNYQTFDKSGATSREKLLFVLTAHELGHALGRNHTDSHDSIMHPVVGLDSLDNPLTNYDRDLLNNAYSVH